MRLAVVIPCLDEERTIGAVLDAVPAALPGISAVERIVVDDGSADATARVAAEHGARVVSHGWNRGVGAAFWSGLQEALRRGADVVVNVDGDGQFDPADLPALVAPILENRADFVTASRFLDPKLSPRMPAVKKWGNHRVARLVSLLTGQTFRDVSCGFRAYSREAALNLNLIGRYTYTHETFLDLAYKGFRILEIPLRVRGEREFGDSRVARSVFRYALETSKILLKTYRDYRPFWFFGRISAALFGVSGLLLGFFFLRYLVTGRFTGHLWAGFTGGSFGAAGLLLLVVAIVADMLDRLRRNQERILYFQKRAAWEKAALPQDPDPARGASTGDGRVPM